MTKEEYLANEISAYLRSYSSRFDHLYLDRDELITCMNALRKVSKDMTNENAITTAIRALEEREVRNGVKDHKGRVTGKRQ